MALSISNVFNCPKPKISAQNSIPSSSNSNFSSSFLRFPGRFAFPKNKIVICAASSAAGRSNPDSDLNPYEVPVVSPIEGFEKVKLVYTRKLEEAKNRGDEATAAVEEGEDDGRGLQMGKRLLRSLSLVFGCIALSSLELIITAASATALYVMASYYR